MSKAISPTFFRVFLLSAALLFVGAIARAPGQDLTRLKDKEVEQLLKSFNAVTISTSDSEMEQLLKKRYNVAIERSRRLAAGTLEGRVSIADLAGSIDLITAAGLELWTDPQERIAVLERKVRFTRVAEDFARTRFREGTGAAEDLDLAKYNHLTAEIQLLRARKALAARKP